MTDERKGVEAIREQVGDALMECWRDALKAASEDFGEQMAMTGMLMTAVEALRHSPMGHEGTANMLDLLARGVRSGEEVSVTIGDDVTEH